MAHYGTINSSSAAKPGSKSTATVNETESLLSSSRADQDETEPESNETSTKHLIAFYISHALFMWNNRCYEFAAVLFTSTALPDTLTAASIRALCAHLASVLFSPSIGRWFNRHPTRLWPVQTCIAAQRLCITLACFGWIPLMLGGKRDSTDKTTGERWAHGVPAVFAVLILLGMVERLSAVGNLAIIEREWLPLLSTQTLRASPGQDTATSTNDSPGTSTVRSDSPSNLHILNATTKGIDLVTKLVAPLAVSGLVISTGNVKTSAAILALIQPISCGIEIYCTHLVWRSCIATRALRLCSEHSSNEAVDHISANSGSNDSSTTKTTGKSWRDVLVDLLPTKSLKTWLSSFASYLKHPVSLPSLAYVLEPFSVLTMAGSMTAYLLVANFSLNEITVARTASTIVEISSTVLTPLLISWVARRNPSSTVDSTRPLIHVGILGLSWQLLCLLPVTIIFMISPALDGSTSTSASYLSNTTLLFASLALSRLGPFAYSLVEQQLVQVKVASSQRIEFSSVETALFDVAELARWCMLMVFSRAENFRWAALISFVSVVVSFWMVVGWARRRGSEGNEADGAD